MGRPKKKKKYTPRLTKALTGIQVRYYGKLAELVGKEEEEIELEGIVNLRDYFTEKYPELEDVIFRIAVNEETADYLDVEEIQLMYKQSPWARKNTSILIELFHVQRGGNRTGLLIDDFDDDDDDDDWDI